MGTSLVGQRATLFIKFLEEWATTSFAVLIHPATPIDTKRSAAKYKSVIDSNNLRFAASSIVLANVIFTLVSAQSVSDVVKSIPFLILLLIGWTLYSFVNHFVLYMLGGTATPLENISACFVLISVIYVISTFFGVALVVALAGSLSLSADDKEAFIFVSVPVFTIMNFIYFPLVFGALNKMDHVRFFIYILITGILTLSQAALLLTTAYYHHPPTHFLVD
jgi:hypothetical protein